MKILFVEWGSYGSRDTREAFLKEGHDLCLFPFEVSSAYPYGKYIEDPETEERLKTVLHESVPDIVFSINYFPVISRVCQKEMIRYISWNYDCPHRLLYSPTVLNSCNRVYVFDKAVCQEFHHEGITNIQYMPLAVNTDRLDQMDASSPLPYSYDVSFVGSLYLEKGDDTFDRIEHSLPDYARGYLRALCTVQLEIQGYDFTESISAPVLDDMYRAYPLVSEPLFRESREHIYGDIIKQRLTAIERINLLELIARDCSVDLFTHIVDFPLQNVCNHGPVSYDTEMPQVFKQSRINLNITLRNIKSGIPLRAFDIMGCGGFLLSNYQADFLDCFVPGEDFVYYENPEDLKKKIRYYLTYEEERKAVARNGHDKVASGHTYRHRIRELLHDV